MGNLKKAISLNRASKISGYNQDYLSSLLRKNELRGEKLGGNWFTTEDEVRNYIFKKKVRNKNWITRSLLYFIKINKSFLYSLIFLALFSTGIYIYNKKLPDIQAKTPSTKTSSINNLGTTNELKF